MYFLLNGNKQVLIHYVGDETIAVNFSHGNSKCDSSVFHRTCPSVLSNLSSIKDFPYNVYKQCISSDTLPPQLKSSHNPRNSRQIINLQQANRRRKNRLTKDAIYNLHEMAYDLGGFVKVIKTYPDLVVV